MVSALGRANHCDVAPTRGAVVAPVGLGRDPGRRSVVVDSSVTSRLTTALLAAVMVAGCSGPGSQLAASAQRASYHEVGRWTDGGGKPLREPFGIAVNPHSGSVLVADARNHQVVVYNQDGAFVRALGSEGTSAGEFSKPTGVAVSWDGSIYVSDYDLDRVQKFTAEGKFVLQWGSSADSRDQLRSPNGLAIDRDGNVYVADFYNKVVKVFDAHGRFLHNVGEPGQWGRGALDYPTDVDIAPDGTILVADAYNHRIQLFAADSAPLAAWGWHLLWVWPRPAGGARGFDIPTGVAASPEGRFVHIADSANARVVMLDRQGGFVTEWKIAKPNGTYHSPVMLAASPDGRRVYATDIANHRILVLEVRTDE